MIGADGARSEARRALGIEFEGFTWPERFLVISTPYDFRSVIADLCSVSYLADPERWHFLLEIPGLWRVMFPITQDLSDEAVTEESFAQSLMATIVPRVTNYEIAHVTLYKVHQRVAKSFRVGRVFLAGDAAHVNNPLGGMGMNGGIHDAINLTMRLAGVWAGRDPEQELDRYDRQRRLVTLEHIEKQSIQNKRNLECANPEFVPEMRRISGDFAAGLRLSAAGRHDRQLAPRRGTRVTDRIAARNAAKTDTKIPFMRDKFTSGGRPRPSTGFHFCIKPATRFGQKIAEQPKG